MLSGGLVMSLTKYKLGELIYEITRKNDSLEYGIEYVRQHKEFMFGELKHNEKKFLKIKQTWNEKQK